MKTVAPHGTKPIAVYAAKSEDVNVLMSSSSGGVFTELAKVTLSRGGVVFGAGWDANFNVVHKCVENRVGLDELRGAKYVRSDMNGSITRIKELLVKQRKVLFTGTPCQCAAVRKACGGDQNLLICGIMCHSTVNPEVWRKYLEEVKLREDDSIVAVNFRDKALGWKHSTFKVNFRNGRRIEEPLYDNIYAKIFFSGIAAPEACLSCQFRSGAHGADLLIGDFWGVEKTYPELFDSNGVSAVIAYTLHGKDAIEHAALSLMRVSYSDVLSYNPYLEKSIVCGSGARKRFESVWRRVSLRRAYAYACSGPWYRRVASLVSRKLRTIAGRMSRVR